MRDGTPQEWLKCWAERYGYASNDDPEYLCLIQKHKALSSDDFTRIGKWKDNAASLGRWKPNVASVAYLIWEQAAAELPQCPEESGVGAFLEGWSTRAYTDICQNGPREKHFGLSRATTLLHFVSGARYPIFDARVKTAISRLLGQAELSGTVSSYLNSYVPLFNELAERCEAPDSRILDKALFSYGALEKREFSN